MSFIIIFKNFFKNILYSYIKLLIKKKYINIYLNIILFLLLILYFLNYFSIKYICFKNNIILTYIDVQILFFSSLLKLTIITTNIIKIWIYSIKSLISIFFYTILDVTFFLLLKWDYKYSFWYIMMLEFFNHTTVTLSSVINFFFSIIIIMFNIILFSLVYISFFKINNINIFLFLIKIKKYFLFKISLIYNYIIQGIKYNFYIFFKNLNNFLVFSLKYFINWTPWWIYSIDLEIVFIFIIYLYIMVILLQNVYYLLLYLFFILFLFGLVIFLYNLELFVGFLWLIESTIILISVLALFNLNIQGLLTFFTKVDLNFFIYLNFFFFFIVILNTNLNIFYDVQILKFNYLWENYYEAFLNINSNDFTGLFINLYILFSFEFILICLILLIGTLICIKLHKLKSSLNFKTSFLQMIVSYYRIISYFFFRVQNLKKQSTQESLIKTF